MSGSEAINESIRLQGVALITERDLLSAERTARLARRRVGQLRHRLEAEKAAAALATRNARAAMGMS
jgi:hypothetical protein